MDLELIIGAVCLVGAGLLALLRKFLKKSTLHKLEAKKFETLGRAISEQYKLIHKQEVDHLKRIKAREEVAKEENAADLESKTRQVTQSEAADVLAMIRAENEKLSSKP